MDEYVLVASDVDRILIGDEWFHAKWETVKFVEISWLPGHEVAGLVFVNRATGSTISAPLDSVRAIETAE